MPLLEARRAVLHEAHVVQLLGQQHVRQAECKDAFAAGPDTQPGVRLHGRNRAAGLDVHEAPARPPPPKVSVGAMVVAGRSPALQQGGAEAHDHARAFDVVGDAFGATLGQPPRRPQGMRHTRQAQVVRAAVRLQEADDQIVQGAAFIPMQDADAVGCAGGSQRSQALGQEANRLVGGDRRARLLFVGSGARLEQPIGMQVCLQAGESARAEAATIGGMEGVAAHEHGAVAHQPDQRAAARVAL